MASLIRENLHGPLNDQRCGHDRPLEYHSDLVGPNGEAVLEADGTPKMITTAHEKGIDVRLALDVVALARKRQFDIALIFSQDQDLQELATRNCRNISGAGALDAHRVCISICTCIFRSRN